MKKLKLFVLLTAAFSLLLMPAPAVQADGAGAVSSVFGGNGYAQYSESYYTKSRGNDRITLTNENITLMSSAEENEIEEKSAVLIKEGGCAEYSFSTVSAGMYSLQLCYYNVEGGGNNINVEWSIDGSVPFKELSYHTLYRRWHDEYCPGEVKDSRGNDILPSQVEEHCFQTVYVSDTSGTFSEPYRLFLSSGEHTLRITSKREPLAVHSISIGTADELPDYSELEKEYSGKEFADGLITYEAEKVSAKSDSTLYASSDKTSPLSTPYSAGAIALNMTGGAGFASGGQWMEWEVEAEKTALYTITFRARQNALSGAYVCRKIYIDSAVPCKEFADLHFSYSSSWRNVSLPPVLLEKGKHIIRMEVTIGDLSNIVSVADEAVAELNLAYRRIIMITTANPDRYRSYNLRGNLPEIFEVFRNQAEALESCNARLIEKTGKRGSMNAVLQTFSKQLRSFCEDADEVQKSLSSYKTNISALSSWVSQMKSQSLELEKLYLSGTADELPEAEAGFFPKLVHELRSFISSFYADYSTIGDTAAKTDTSIEVWVQAGRDQANIIRSLVTAGFESENCSGVDIKLVQNQLLAATASGRGPDVAMQVAASEPVNYATRGASYNLASFGDFPEISERFRNSALTPYEFDGGVYALPETQTFQVMFCRDDILSELGLSVPRTWDEMFVTLGRLQKKNMTIGIQSSLATVTMLLYQRGGQLYTDNNSKSGLSSPEAQEAFKEWVSFYIDYSTPVSYNALDRFRTGEMPVLIEDFTFYNTLQASAPEIRGMWSFTSVPGTENDNSTDRTSVGGGICCMLLSGTENPQGAWDFMKWWTSEDVQSKYGYEMENRLGASARYASANTEAFTKMPWSVAELETLVPLWENVRGIPEVAGGYFTARHISNAFRRVLNHGEDEKLTLLDYAANIDDEITAKRRELGIK